MQAERLLEIFDDVAVAVRSEFERVEDRRLPGERSTQYRFDLGADGVAVDLLLAAGVGVLSEESGRHRPDREIYVVVDPIDGSTNASRHIPWFATSLAAVDRDGPLATMVVNQATGTRYTAIRGDGAHRDGRRITTSSVTELSAAMIAVNGSPERPLGWSQYRALGAAALDLCLVAEGAIDGYVDCADSNHGAWDYLGAMLVLTEAGGVISDLDDRALVVDDHEARRAPVAAATPGLHAALLAARRAAAA